MQRVFVLDQEKRPLMPCTSARARKTRYRQARYLNRRRREGWLPPSLETRVANIVC